MSELERLRDDETTPAALRQALREAATANPPYDAAAGLTRFEARIHAGPTAAARVLPRLALVGAAVAVVVGLAFLAARFATPSHGTLPAAPQPASITTPPPRSTQTAPNPGDATDVPPAIPTTTTIDAPARTAPRAADPLALELRLVAEARRSARTVPTHALALLARADREVGDGVLGREREALRIEALVAVGRGAEASRRAHTFLTTHPDDPLEQRVRAAIDTRP